MAIKATTRFSINLNDGRIVFRNPEVDEQINYHPIPDDVARMLSKGKISAKKVIEACEKKIKEKGELTLQEYLKKQELLNTRTRKNIIPPESNEPIVDPRADELISLDDIIEKPQTKDEALPPNKEEEDTSKKSKKNSVLGF